MDQLWVFYDSPELMKAAPVPEQELNINTYGTHALNPIINHRIAGMYPLQTPMRKVTYELEQPTPVLFQTAPQFYYAPHHSNVDVDLNY